MVIDGNYNIRVNPIPSLFQLNNTSKKVGFVKLAKIAIIINTKQQYKQ